jgi:hypothetical protein
MRGAAVTQPKDSLLLVPIRRLPEKWKSVKSCSERLRSRLDGDILPVFGRRPIADVEPIEVLEAIRKIEDIPS